jgi:dTDP-4-dehydrorhamnose reductase
MKIMVVGASGMIGSTTFRVLSETRDWDVCGTIRKTDAKQFFSAQLNERLVDGIDVEDEGVLSELLGELRPDVVVNCAGLTKHRSGADDPLVSVPINTLMPHRLAGCCERIDARLIHISTDCVFSGAKGGYVEEDATDAQDVYGQSKALGELYYPHTVTLRTSTIGHELQSQFGLLEWFMSQEKECKGYTRAVFSGLPTMVFARIIRDIVIPDISLTGLYHVAAKPIDKYSLLELIAQVYGRTINIVADDTLVIDRSLDASRFQLATGYIAPEWPELIKQMFEFK